MKSFKEDFTKCATRRLLNFSIRKNSRMWLLEIQITTGKHLKRYLLKAKWFELQFCLFVSWIFFFFFAFSLECTLRTRIWQFTSHHSDVLEGFTQIDFGGKEKIPWWVLHQEEVFSVRWGNLVCHGRHLQQIMLSELLLARWKVLYARLSQHQKTNVNIGLSPVIFNSALLLNFSSFLWAKYWGFSCSWVTIQLPRPCGMSQAVYRHLCPLLYLSFRLWAQFYAYSVLFLRPV